MFKRRKQKKSNPDYDRVYQLHKQAEFLCYIDDAYMEKYQGKEYVKLLGIVAIGRGLISDTYQLYNCKGQKKADITMEELYVGQNRVEEIQGGDKPVALYPKQQEISYIAGDILCKFSDENMEESLCQ